MFSMRARTLRGASSFLFCSLGFSGSRQPSAPWPSPRCLAGRGGAWVMVGWLLVRAGIRNAQTTVAVRRRRSGCQLEVQVVGSTASRQTATATNALEVDMPTPHQQHRKVEAVGDGHVAIVP